MSRSRKQPWVTISKAWDRWKERGLRHKVKQRLREVEIDFDPDEDFIELGENHKKLGEWGTRCGFKMPPKDSDPIWWHEEYERLRRK